MSDTSFPERERGYETKFARDEEYHFRLLARRDKLLASWAADRLGLAEDARAALVAQTLAVDGHPAHDAAVLAKITASLEAGGIKPDASEVAQAMARCTVEADRQLQA